MRFVEAATTVTPVLGTDLELRVGVDPTEEDALETIATAALDAVLREIDRLEPILSVHDPASELRRWRAGALADDQVSAELVEVLGAAEHWCTVSGGAFNPGAGRVVQLWRAAARAGVAPDPAACAAAASAIARLPYAVVAGRLERRGDTSGIDVNAIAKGWIVDRAVDAARARDPRVQRVVVNLGGDLRHWGRGSLAVGIEDPIDAHDNAGPLAVIDIAGVALATSGSARRGVRIGDRWYGHVMDPRRGWPVDDVASVSVIAPDAATADAVATVVGVLGRSAGLAFMTDRRDVHALVVDPAGGRWRSSGWPADAISEA